MTQGEIPFAMSNLYENIKKSRIDIDYTLAYLGDKKKGEDVISAETAASKLAHIAAVVRRELLTREAWLDTAAEIRPEAQASLDSIDTWVAYLKPPARAATPEVRIIKRELADSPELATVTENEYTPEENPWPRLKKDADLVDFGSGPETEHDQEAAQALAEMRMETAHRIYLHEELLYIDAFTLGRSKASNEEDRHDREMFLESKRTEFDAATARYVQEVLAVKGEDAAVTARVGLEKRRLEVEKSIWPGIFSKKVESLPPLKRKKLGLALIFALSSLGGLGTFLPVAHFAAGQHQRSMQADARQNNLRSQRPLTSITETEVLEREPVIGTARVTDFLSIAEQQNREYQPIRRTLGRGEPADADDTSVQRAVASTASPSETVVTEELTDINAVPEENTTEQTAGEASNPYDAAQSIEAIANTTNKGTGEALESEAPQTP